MSTIWRGLCLSHKPAIEFELFGGTNHEPHDAATALDRLRSSESHAHCDVVAGGFSYPLIAVACPCGAGSGVPIDVEVLKMAYQAARVKPDVAAEPLRTAVSEWLRRNRCWTTDRLATLFWEPGA